MSHILTMGIRVVLRMAQLARGFSSSSGRLSCNRQVRTTSVAKPAISTAPPSPRMLIDASRSLVASPSSPRRSEARSSKRRHSRSRALSLDLRQVAVRYRRRFLDTPTNQQQQYQDDVAWRSGSPSNALVSVLIRTGSCCSSDADRRHNDLLKAALSTASRSFWG